jgi:outer membrane protein OmpA-like peptidoglycan-associated protein
VRRVVPVLLALVLAACGSAPRRDLDFDRLHASLQALSADPELAKLALAERALAEAAVRRLDAASINADEHVQLSYLAERRVDIAYIAAQTERERVRLGELQREHAELLLAASRRETQAMRAELDRQRQRELLQQEDAQRGGVASSPLPAGGMPSPAMAAALPGVAAPGAAPAASPGRVDTLPEQTLASPPPSVSEPPAATASASVAALPPSASAAPATPPSATTAPAAAVATPAPVAPVAPAPAALPATDATLAQRLAALVPDADAGGRRMTLEDLVFEPGTAVIVGEASIALERVAAWLATEPASAVRIEGHTDATGSPEANRTLSLRRAEAVRDALVERGVSVSRIAVSGEGAAGPVASNDDAAGRARNRRVVVRLPGEGG